MVQTHPWKAYRQVAMQTATPGQLILMLFDGALRFLEQASEGFGQEDPIDRYATINNNIQRAQAIINELNCSLNMREGGSLADTLRRLYNYFDHRLTESNMRKQPEGIREVMAQLKVLRNAWGDMLANPNTSPNALALDRVASACA